MVTSLPDSPVLEGVPCTHLTRSLPRDYQNTLFIHSESTGTS